VRVIQIYSCAAGIMVITGEPGVGKSTAIKKIISVHCSQPNNERQ
jgi:nucleoside-triphosphatase THEP1